MIIVKNTCLVCNDTWNVNLNFAEIGEIDKINLKSKNGLYSVCEDCSSDGESHSALWDDDPEEYR